MAWLFLVLGNHMASSLYRGKGESSELPSHASNLILMFMKSWNPPFSPWLFYGDVMVIPESLKPSHSTCRRDICIQVSWINPYADVFFEQDWIQPITLLLTHFVVVSHFITAHLVVNRVYMQELMNWRLIEEVVDSKVIVTVHKIS